MLRSGKNLLQSCKSHRGPGAPARLALEFQLRAVAAGDGEAERKTQPGPALGPAAGLVRPVEGFAQMGQRLPVHAPAVVGHHEQHPARRTVGQQPHPAPGGAGLHPIVAQVYQQAFQQNLVGRNVRSGLRCVLIAESETKSAKAMWSAS